MFEHKQSDGKEILDQYSQGLGLWIPTPPMMHPHQ